MESEPSDARIPFDDKQLIRWEFDAFTDLGFTPMEAVSLVMDGLSPSELREFLRHNPTCDVRIAVAILL